MSSTLGKRKKRKIPRHFCVFVIDQFNMGDKWAT